jgi:putative peptide zinc metalloprotease protein
MPSPSVGEHLNLPALTDGTELVGEYAGSGYRKPPHLIQRRDGQVIHLPDLLYRTVKELRRQRGIEASAERILERVAEELSHATGRGFAAEHVAFLLDEKLAPLGITTRSDGTAPPVTKTEHAVLGLKTRAALVSEHTTWVIAGLFAWLFHPVAVVLLVGALFAAEAWLFTTQNTGAAITGVMAQPLGVLVTVGLTLLSAAFHEVGHASACRYGKVRPGVMGCGIYVVWPAFYTDVTNSYRLGRAGRLRTDLGGVYFNGLFILALTGIYAQAPTPVLLAAILLINLEMVQQLLPTLRFDGYYIMSDLVGIPDLFKYIGPILRHKVLRRPAEPRLRELKRWPQTVVTLWVLLVLPVLAVQLGVVVLRLPDMITQAWATASHLFGTAGSPLGIVASVVQMLFLLLPIIGVGLVLWSLLRTLARLAAKQVRTAGGLPTPSAMLWGLLHMLFALAVAYLLWRMSRTSVRRAESEGPAAPRPVLACELRPFDGGRSPMEPPCGATIFGYAEVPATGGPVRAGQKAAERTDTPPVPLDA